MRITLQNYLKLEGVTIESARKEIGRSRETIRGWRDDKDMKTIVVYDAAANEIVELEFSKRKILKVRK